jgi:hypothetical protein
MSGFTGVNCLREKKESQLMPTTKHELLDWLMDVPEDAEIGTDGAGLALLAILDTNVHLYFLSFHFTMSSCEESKNMA